MRLCWKSQRNTDQMAPRRCSACFAASFRATFFVFPSPCPKTSPSTKTSTDHTGAFDLFPRGSESCAVLLLLPSIPTEGWSAYFQSTCKLFFCTLSLNSARWFTVLSGEDGDGGDAGTERTPPPVLSSFEETNPCDSRRRLYAVLE
jgi:hypothetical protein